MRNPSPIATACSFLFVPGSRPDRFGKALSTDAGCVIIDLEDAVPPDDKRASRAKLDEALAGFTPEQRARTLVRINANGTAWHHDDVNLIRKWSEQGLGGVMLPKSETGVALDELAAAAGAQARIVPLVESLAGLDALQLLASTRQVERIAFGNLDFQLDLGMRCTSEEPELAYPRFAVVAASRRASLPAPIDGVTANTSDAKQLQRDAARARAAGFGAKLCIHPSQVAPVNATFLPSASEIEWATRVVDGAAAQNGAAFSLDGRMVDLPVIVQAQRLLQRAGRLPG